MKCCGKDMAYVVCKTPSGNMWQSYPKCLECDVSDVDYTSTSRFASLALERCIEDTRDELIHSNHNEGGDEMSTIETCRNPNCRCSEIYRERLERAVEQAEAALGRAHYDTFGGNAVAYRSEAIREARAALAGFDESCK